MSIQKKIAPIEKISVLYETGLERLICSGAAHPKLYVCGLFAAFLSSYKIIVSKSITLASGFEFSVITKTLSGLQSKYIQHALWYLKTDVHREIMISAISEIDIGCFFIYSDSNSPLLYNEQLYRVLFALPTQKNSFVSFKQAIFVLCNIPFTNFSFLKLNFSSHSFSFSLSEIINE